jgi:hypothetical protein
MGIGTHGVSALIGASGNRAGLRFLELFAASICNPHTRRPPPISWLGAREQACRVMPALSVPPAANVLGVEPDEQISERVACPIRDPALRQAAGAIMVQMTPLAEGP